jgi:hypothetical protein
MRELENVRMNLQISIICKSANENVGIAYLADLMIDVDFLNL